VAQVLLKQAATRFNLRLANSGADLQAGSDITKTILAEIQAADVVIVLVAEGASANVWYGMGAAAAYDRPVIVVLLSPQAEPPPAIRPTVVVGPVLSIKAIELALERALRRQKDPVADGASRQGDRTGAPLGSKADMHRQVTHLQRRERNSSTGSRHCLMPLRYRSIEVPSRTPLSPVPFRESTLW
jgi:hypothetical protein